MKTYNYIAIKDNENNTIYGIIKTIEQVEKVCAIMDNEKRNNILWCVDDLLLALEYSHIKFEYINVLNYYNV